MSPRHPDHVVIVAGHPDDELLGAWEALKLAQAGASVTVVFPDPEPFEAVSEDRYAESRRLLEHLGVRMLRHTPAFTAMDVSEALPGQALFLTHAPEDTHPGHRLANAFACWLVGQNRLRVLGYFTTEKRTWWRRPRSHIDVRMVATLFAEFCPSQRSLLDSPEFFLFGGWVYANEVAMETRLLYPGEPVAGTVTYPGLARDTVQRVDLTRVPRTAIAIAAAFRGALYILAPEASDCPITVTLDDQSITL